MSGENQYIMLQDVVLSKFGAPSKQTDHFRSQVDPSYPQSPEAFHPLIQMQHFPRPVAEMPISSRAAWACQNSDD